MGLQAVFRTNVAGPVYISQAFLPLVEKSRRKTIVHISGMPASEGLNSYGGIQTSCSIMSAAALDILVRRDCTMSKDHYVLN